MEAVTHVKQASVKTFVSGRQETLCSVLLPCLTHCLYKLLNKSHFLCIPMPLLQGIHQLLRHKCCQRGLERFHLCIELSLLCPEAAPRPPLVLPVRDHHTDGPALRCVHSQMDGSSLVCFSTAASTFLCFLRVENK